ncbi:MAG: tripartite tricarboxylate transporter substrate binding protein [Pseudomonadota bacterium]
MRFHFCKNNLTDGSRQPGIPWRRHGTHLGAILALIIALVPATTVLAQHDYPSRPIRLITPAAPGGTTDILARLFGAKLSEVFKQQVVVDNRASASGVNAGELTANAAPDGYTLMLAYHQHTVNAALNPNLPYHPVNSFTPITQLTTAGLVLVVNPSSPVKTLKEFIDWTKNYKGALNFGSAGIGSGGHLAGELYKQLAGVKAEHIPYKGSGPSMMDLVAGQYQFSFAGMQASQGLARSGKLRALAVTTPKRLAAMPELPAVAELVPGFEIVGWYGVIGPAGLPKPILTRLNDELIKALKRPEVRGRIVSDGATPVGNTPEAFRSFMLADLAKWAKLVKESGAKLN